MSWGLGDMRGEAQDEGAIGRVELCIAPRWQAQADRVSPEAPLAGQDVASHGLDNDADRVDLLAWQQAQDNVITVAVETDFGRVEHLDEAGEHIGSPALAHQRDAVICRAGCLDHLGGDVEDGPREEGPFQPFSQNDEVGVAIVGAQLQAVMALGAAETELRSARNQNAVLVPDADLPEALTSDSEAELADGLAVRKTEDRRIVIGRVQNPEAAVDSEKAGTAGLQESGRQRQDIAHPGVAVESGPDPGRGGEFGPGGKIAGCAGGEKLEAHRHRICRRVEAKFGQRQLNVPGGAEIEASVADEIADPGAEDPGATADLRVEAKPEIAVGGVQGARSVAPQNRGVDPDGSLDRGFQDQWWPVYHQDPVAGLGPSKIDRSIARWPCRSEPFGLESSPGEDNLALSGGFQLVDFWPETSEQRAAVRIEDDDLVGRRGSEDRDIEAAIAPSDAVWPWSCKRNPCATFERGWKCRQPERLWLG